MSSRGIVAAILSVVVGLLMSGCEQEGPTERAGKRIDRTVEQSVDRAEEAGDALQKQLDAIGKKVEKHVQDTERRMPGD